MGWLSGWAYNEKQSGRLMNILSKDYWLTSCFHGHFRHPIRIDGKISDESYGHDAKESAVKLRLHLFYSSNLGLLVWIQQAQKHKQSNLFYFGHSGVGGIFIARYNPKHFESKASALLK
jgi:hypothetical protein